MILIAFILTFIEFGIGVITFIMHVGGLNNLITNKVPQFVIEDGKLTAESEMSLDIGNATIYMNTDYDRITLDDIKTNGRMNIQRWISINYSMMGLTMISLHPQCQRSMWLLSLCTLQLCSEV